MSWQAHPAATVVTLGGKRVLPPLIILRCHLTPEKSEASLWLPHNLKALAEWSWIR